MTEFEVGDYVKVITPRSVDYEQEGFIQRIEGNFYKVSNSYWYLEQEIARADVPPEAPAASDAGSGAAADVPPYVDMQAALLNAQKSAIAHYEACQEAQAENADLRKQLAAAQERERRNLEWAYALMVELAVVCLEDTNRITEPGDWPNGQEWDELTGTSRSIFMHKARELAGIDHDAWRKVFESEVDDRMVDIWERKAAQQPGQGD